MAGRGAFVEQDRRAAENFAACARDAGLRRIVYLGGLGTGLHLSPHLESRQEVGRILRESGVPTIELRASIIIGSGSLSFEMIRALVEKLPVMVTPRWVRIRSQPIFINDVIEYLAVAPELHADRSLVVEIGGADRVTYQEIMEEYARQRGLRRYLIPVPVLTPRLSSLWLGLVTPVHARVGRILVDSLPHETVVKDDSASRWFPAIRPGGIRPAIREALREEDRAFLLGKVPDLPALFPGSRFVDTRTADLRRPPENAFRPIRRIGGRTGWYYADWLWMLRGLVDRLAGGAGLRRGRRDPESIQPGDPVDFWRVDAFEPDRRLRLAAEMKLPGRAWLQFDVEERPPGSRIRQTAVFDPKGLAGRIYWYVLFPVHQFVFAGMLRGIVREANRTSDLP
jgi:uncharacterized protein YbjT (DUF2867 family)